MPYFSYSNVTEIINTLRPINSVYCLSTDNIKAQVKLFQTWFPGSVSWAVKSNPEPIVIKTIYEAGLLDFDVASLKEVELISTLCPKARLCFNHPVKSAEAIKESYFKYGVRIFIADHTDEITKIFNAIDGNTDILLQIRFFDPIINPDSHVNFGKKFGASPQESVELIKFAKQKGFHKLGLAFHPSTQYPTPNIYQHLIDVAWEIAKAVSDEQTHIQMLNIGGGFPVAYPSENILNENEYFHIVKTAIQEAKQKFGPNCEFMCEPGRALVASSASLLTRVELNRHDGRLYINDGFYGGLMEQHFVGFSLPIRVHTHNHRKLSLEKRNFILFGPTCDSVDVLSKPYSLPENIEIGDYLEFGLMGAYSNASATHFNGFKPAEILQVNKLDIL